MLQDRKVSLEPKVLLDTLARLACKESRVILEPLDLKVCTV